jgi:pimeloyl-ACP methyl ester carboxylesterase
MILGQSIALAADRVLTPIEGMHLAIAHGWFAAAGSPGGAVRRVHDAVSSVVYGSVRLGSGVLADAVSHRTSADSPIALKGQAIVNGLWGDDLGPFEGDLAISMTLRSAAGDVVADGSGSTLAPPDATPHLVVLVHGLFESESCWSGDKSGSGLIEALETRPHVTVLNARYNSGRRISDNGEELALMLDVLCVDWPVPIQSIVLVGNSMGGLVIRSACAVAESLNHEWFSNVRDVVTVATPHRGTPIEKGVEIAASALSIAEPTKPLGAFLDSRSVGIKGLRHGTIAAYGNGLAPNVDHHLISAVISSDSANLIGEALGDLVVRPASALMAGDQSVASATIIGGTNHFSAVTSPAVVDRVLVCVDREAPSLDA